MVVIINGNRYEGREIVVDVDKITIYYGTYAEDGLEHKTDIIGAAAEISIESGEISYTVGWLKKQLADTDYVVIKIAEGTAAPEEYADIIAQRQAWRAAINALEGTAQ